MSNGFFSVPKPLNEPVLNYRTGSPERSEVLAVYKEMYANPVTIPLYIGEEKIVTEKRANMAPPHDHKHSLGTYSLAEKKHIDKAITTALKIKNTWENMSFEHRAAIFLKAADLVAGPYRAKINASTMLAQSKNIFQAEIDAACEFADFLRFNVAFAADIYAQQPIQGNGVINRLEYRALEGFVYAVTPFNFTAIAGNLCAAPALMGNVVVWKPSDHQMFSAKIIMDIFEEAGVPAGVITLISGDPVIISNTVLAHASFAGLHFTGSTEVFKNLWKQIGNNLSTYQNYPRIVGETGGKDFIFAHHSADIKTVVTAITRGGYEFQGQKCSAASRIYLPASIANSIISGVVENIKSFSIGSPEDMNNFITAVIHEHSFDKLVHYIEQAKKDSDVEVLAGGTYDKSTGYFVHPTLLKTTNPHYTTMETELFGPVVTVYVYEDSEWEATLELVNTTSEYALTGAIIAQDRRFIEEASGKLRHAAGNFYINDKPSGAVVGQQPFGGSRASGTNDKAGSALNLMRWVSPRLIKETLVPATDYRYPCMD
ncbi:MAG: L-glutamate gamma-semialdehyde dehydrogenase [Bacteroidetes bacterium]|nr:L-glutamate gamma-semialdehyde dehydrogenase [Bacteroidota bacterium]MDA0888657.1 L-glutamate gamma-semialdehyde dehydrogenase [Bacteroidota bacterium]MDA1084872.1 L-glutamate gamma-semialdehyde dehydrogenase [Bacteroidota bacterium]